MNKQNLTEKTNKVKEDINFFEQQTNKILFDTLQKSVWYPECHNDSEKIKCDHCMDCWSVECNQSNCDRTGRCICENSSCICLGR